ncbi:flagellar basal body-associated FliL family protein [Lutibacter sp. B2]|nr:flagellar basal body-associated FliL family protein [Lutibacter sp. B2]
MTTKKIIIFSIIGFLVTGILLGGIFYFTTSKNSNDKPKEVETTLYSLGELYSNIKDNRRILKINIDIEISDEDVTPKLEKKKSEIINNILEILRSKEIAVLDGTEGQQALRKEIVSSIKKTVPSDGIMDVYFVEFIIQ